MSGATRLSTYLKNNNLKTLISFVGSHVQALPKKTLENEKSIDFVFLNEGVYSIWNILKLDEISLENISNVKTLILNEIEDIKKNTVSKKEFQEAIERVKFYYKDRMSSLQNIMLISATDELYTNDHMFSEHYEKEISTLTIDTVLNTARKHLINHQTMIFNPKKITKLIK